MQKVRFRHGFQVQECLILLLKVPIPEPDQFAFLFLNLTLTLNFSFNFFAYLSLYLSLYLYDLKMYFPEKNLPGLKPSDFKSSTNRTKMFSNFDSRQTKSISSIIRTYSKQNLFVISNCLIIVKLK